MSHTPLNQAPARRLARAIESWFAKAQRPLPWRPDRLGAPRDPYTCLVSELMLQQTQVSRVIDRFETFTARFPSVEALAAGDEQDVLALWSGLGYYRRARNLHSAARVICDKHEGRFPTDPKALQTLPGVGRYTAGAIASMAFNVRTPAVDGNVTRVLLRIDADDAPQDATETQKRLWARAQSLVEASDRPGVLNEALMELGATVCTPRSPACDRCPVRTLCAAHAQGRERELPTPKSAPQRTELFCDAVRIRDSRGRLLVERRDHSGLWGGLYQAPTLDRTGQHARQPELRAWIGADSLQRAERFTHQTTHRLVRFRVWDAPAVRGMKAKGPVERTWRSKRQLEALALSSAQRRILLPA